MKKSLKINSLNNHNNNALIFHQRKAKGQELLDKICQSMNLLEKDYFGLIYEDKHDPRNWLDLDRRISKFLKSMFIVKLLY